MKKLVVIASLAALIGGSAAAADLPTHKEAPAPYVPPPAFSWSGFYLGINGGWDFSHNGATQTTGSPAFAALIAPGFVPGSLPTGGGGGMFGGQIGYNWQMGTFVGGLETDLDWVGQRHSASFVGAVLPAPFGTSLTTSASHNLDYLGTLRGRIGMTPFDRGLLYLTGGLAYGGVQTTGQVVANAAPALAWNGSTSQTRVGWTLGGGGEYAFTNNVTFKAEALYYDLGTTSTTALGNAAVAAVPALNGVFYTSQTRTAGVVARGGINFKF